VTEKKEMYVTQKSRYSSCTGIGLVKIYVAAAAAEALRKKGNETQFITKIGGKKTSLGPNYIWFRKISFSVTHLMPYYAETGHSCPLITLLFK
jgi:hypothetical protein